MNREREHFVAGQAPDWSRRALRFKHFDGSDADWRSTLPKARARVRRRRRARVASRLVTFYVIFGAVLVLAFRALAVHP